MIFNIFYIFFDWLGWLGAALGFQKNLCPRLNDGTRSTGVQWLNEFFQGGQILHLDASMSALTCLRKVTCRIQLLGISQSAFFHQVALSFASLNASVMAISICFHLRSVLKTCSRMVRSTR